MGTRFGNVRKGEKLTRPKLPPRHVITTLRAAEILAIKHHFRVVRGEPVPRPGAPRLTANLLHTLIEEHAPKALIGWRGFGPHSSFEKCLNKFLRDFYADMK